MSKLDIASVHDHRFGGNHLPLTFRKARRVLKKRGVGALVKRGKNELLGAVSAYLALRTKPKFQDLASLVDFTNTAFGGFLHPIQVRSEILSLVELVQDLKPRTVLEIGTAKGAHCSSGRGLPQKMRT